MPSTDLSLIIPAYNEEKLLPKTLDALNCILKEIKSKWSGEIIVVDNNSDDNTANIAESHNALVVFEGENCIAKARNRGAEAANGRFLIFVDADTIPTSDLILKSLDLLSSGKVCGGGAKVKFDIDKMPFFANLILIWWETVTFFIPLAAGSYLFCLAEAWKDIGGFYEKLYASEEVNFSYKLKRWGRKHKMKFILLQEHITTSARKIYWFAPAHLFFFIMLNCLFPFLVRNRRFCYMWYKRPE
jgi:glycosyltransferase involved in cell wall biosynthesis